MRHVAYVLEHNVCEGKGKTRETLEVGKRGRRGGKNYKERIGRFLLLC